VNTLSSDNKTEREVERKQAGLSFLIANLGVPWALRPNSPVLSRSCPKRVLFFFRRELPQVSVRILWGPRVGLLRHCIRLKAGPDERSRSLKMWLRQCCHSVVTEKY